MFRLPLALVFLITGIALAQNPVAPAAPVPGAPEMTRLQFPNTEVKLVLDFYERATKKRLIIDNQVQGQVHIVVAGDLPVDEAIRIIEINLLLNGFTLVAVEGSNMVKVISGGRNPRTAAIPIISEELLLPEGEQVVTFLARLQYADPLEVQQTLVSFLAPTNYTHVAPLPKSRAILITENTATIRGLLRVLREIDVPPAEVVSEFISLRRANAIDVLEQLAAIFEKQPNQAGATVTHVVPPPPDQPGQPGVTVTTTTPGTLEIRGGTLSEDSIIIGKIKVTADIRTNRIHVVARPVNQPFIRQLIADFDAIAKFGEPVARPLRYVFVGDVLDVIVKAISEPGMKEDGSAAGGSKPAQGAAAGGGARGFGGAGGDGGGGGFDVSEELATEAVDTTPEARVVGTTKIIADKNANAIIVIGGADVVAKVFRLLDHLDQRIPQVMLHTVIGELNLTERQQFGVDYIIRNSGLGLSPIVLNGSNGTPPPVNDGTGTGVAADASDNAGTTNNLNNAPNGGLVSLAGGAPVLNLNNLLNQNTVRAIAGVGGSGLSGFVTAGNSLTAVVSALEDTNRFRVVSRPSVFTRNNKKAIIASGQEIAVPTSILSSPNSINDAGIATQSQVQFKRVALQLEVVPLINSDREVSLDILQKVDEVAGSTRIDNNDIPNIATRYVKTSVTVPNEGTLVLGGLIKQSQNRVKSGIPLLSSIPLVGYLFSTTTKEKLRTELVILIRPVVSWAPPESVQIRERAQEFLNMDPDLEATLFPKGVRKTAPPETPYPKATLVQPAKRAKAGTPPPKKLPAPSSR